MKNTEISLRKVAEENGVSVEEVRREIQAIIDDLYNSDDPEIKSKWRSLTETGQKEGVDRLWQPLRYFQSLLMTLQH